MNKKIRGKLLVLLSAVVLCTGCNSGKNRPEDVTVVTGSEENIVYQPSFVQLSCELGKEDAVPPRAFSHIFVNEKAVYGVVEHSDDMTHTRSNYVVIKDIEGDGYTKKQLGTLGDYFKTSQGFAGSANKKLMLYDDNFDLLKEIDLKNVEKALSDRNERLSVGDVDIDEQGNIGIVGEKTLVYIDSEGTVSGMMDKPANMGGIGYLALGRILAAPSGKWYFLCVNNEYKVDIYNIDRESGRLGDRLENVPDIYEGNMRELGVSENGVLYIITETYIYEYNVDNSDYTTLVCLQDYGINSSEDSGESGFGRAQSGTFYIASVEDIDLSGQAADVAIELAVLEGKQAADVTERKQLVLSAFTAPSWIYAEPINKFNRYNTEYYVTVKPYFNYDYDEYDTALTRFYNDLITGNGADLFWFNIDDNLDIDNLADKGILTDLYTCIDKDGDIGREDFIPSVLSSLEDDGRLYVMAPEFKLVTIVGSEGLLNADEDWNFTTMYELLEKYSGAQLFAREKNSFELERFLKYSMDLFYDKDTGECSFESDDFINMLKLVQTLPDTYTSVPDDEINDKLKKKEVLLEELDSMDIINIKMLDMHFDNIEKVYLGYPSKSHASAQLVFDNNMAMSAVSENQAAAWEFMKYYLTNFEPSGMPVFEDKFEAQLYAAMHEYEDSVKGHNPLNSNLTSQQADTLRELAYTASGYKQYDMAVYNIVYEEAMSFISGQSSAAEAAAIIQNRVQLYLDEKK